MNVYEEDAELISSSKEVEWDLFYGKTLLLTGATGLIGATLLRGILRHNKVYISKIHVVAIVRSIEKAQAMFGDVEDVEWVKGDINSPIYYGGDIDFVIHGASETSSQKFVDEPVETIRTSINGTMNVLELAKAKKVKSFVYLSSMEIYGTPYDEQLLDEHRYGYLDSLVVRSSYPESKRLSENLCIAYASEYEVSTKIARLTQSFGPGVMQNDNRVFAQFARAVVSGRDIVLHTTGDTKRMYIYTAEAAIAILIILTKGKKAEAYNVANEDTYCSIKEMAEMIMKTIGKNKNKVIIRLSAEMARKYNAEQHMKLDVSKLQELGFKATIDLATMYKRMIESY